MGNGIDRNLADHVLADVARTAIAAGLTGQSMSKNQSNHKLGARIYFGTDLPSYLRNVRRWLMAKEIAAILRWHPETVYRRIHTQQFPADRDGRRWKFDPGEVANRIEQWSSYAIAGTAAQILKELRGSEAVASSTAGDRTS